MKTPLKNRGLLLFMGLLFTGCGANKPYIRLIFPTAPKKFLNFSEHLKSLPEVRVIYGDCDQPDVYAYAITPDGDAYSSPLNLRSIMQDQNDYSSDPLVFGFSAQDIIFNIPPDSGTEVGFVGMAYRSSFFSGVEAATDCKQLGYRIDYLISGNATLSGESVVSVPTFISPALITGGSAPSPYPSTPLKTEAEDKFDPYLIKQFAGSSTDPALRVYLPGAYAVDFVLTSSMAASDVLQVFIPTVIYSTFIHENVEYPLDDSIRCFNSNSINLMLLDTGGPRPPGAGELNPHGC